MHPQVLLNLLNLTPIRNAGQRAQQNRSNDQIRLVQRCVHDLRELEELNTKRLITADTNTHYYTHRNENEILHKVTKGKLNDHCRSGQKPVAPPVSDFNCESLISCSLSSTPNVKCRPSISADLSCTFSIALRMLFHI